MYTIWIEFKFYFRLEAVVVFSGVALHSSCRLSYISLYIFFYLWSGIYLWYLSTSNQAFVILWSVVAQRSESSLYPFETCISILGMTLILWTQIMCFLIFCKQHYSKCYYLTCTILIFQSFSEKLPFMVGEQFSSWTHLKDLSLTGNKVQKTKYLIFLINILDSIGAVAQW